MQRSRRSSRRSVKVQKLDKFEMNLEKPLAEVEKNFEKIKKVEMLEKARERLRRLRWSFAREAQEI